MKKISLIISLFVCFSATIYGQKQKTIYYNTDWEVCDKVDAKYYRIIKLDKENKPVGKVKDYYSTGELQGECYLSFFDPNSKDVLDSLCIWYNKNGNISQTANFDNGILSGEYKTFHDSGELSTIGNYLNDNRIGEWKSYYLDGSIYTIKNYNEEGLLNGEWRHYYQDGQLKTKLLFKNNLLMEVLDCRDPLGYQLEIGSFKNGNGVVNIYDDLGFLAEKATFEEGKLIESVDYSIIEETEVE